MIRHATPGILCTLPRSPLMRCEPHMTDHAPVYWTLANAVAYGYPEGAAFTIAEVSSCEGGQGRKARGWVEEGMVFVNAQGETLRRENGFMTRRTG